MKKILKPYCGSLLRNPGSTNGRCMGTWSIARRDLELSSVLSIFTEDLHKASLQFFINNVAPLKEVLDSEEPIDSEDISHRWGICWGYKWHKYNKHISPCDSPSVFSSTIGTLISVRLSELYRVFMAYAVQSTHTSNSQPTYITT